MFDDSMDIRIKEIEQRLDFFFKDAHKMIIEGYSLDDFFDTKDVPIEWIRSVRNSGKNFVFNGLSAGVADVCLTISRKEKDVWEWEIRTLLRVEPAWSALGTVSTFDEAEACMRAIVAAMLFDIKTA